MIYLAVFEKFGNNSSTNWRLCLSHYLSTPGLNWDAMLKITKSELVLIPGRISYISNRYSKANNKYLRSYDLKQESKHT